MTASPMNNCSDATSNGEHNADTHDEGHCYPIHSKEWNLCYDTTRFNELNIKIEHREDLKDLGQPTDR